jgi:SAM-dependent methyltransferase
MMQDMAWEGDEYQARFDLLAQRGVDVHGEAAFVLGLRPRPATVLDAGCGTGRVAIELARHGIDVVGVDIDASMLATARKGAPDIDWREHNLTAFDLGRAFDAVVLAGNVPLFTPAGTQPALVAHCARHVASTGVMVTGFQLGRGYSLSAFDEHCAAAGLILVDRYATWDRVPFAPGGDYAVSVHRTD